MDSRKIKRALQEGNLKYRIVTEILNLFGYSNRNIAGLEIKNKVYQYLERNYGRKIGDFLYEKAEEYDASGDKYIWICWFQGMESAPELVKRCYASVKRNMPNKEVIVITKENMDQYVDFPEHILGKWKKGLITDTKMSDFLRMELLIRYGGLWMDSTIFLSGPIPDWVYEKDIFMYSIDDSEDITRVYNNYFIYSKKDYPVLKTLRDINYYYWGKENKVRDYFQWHLFTTLVIPYYKDLFEDIVFMPDAISHMLGKVFFKKYEKNYWETLKIITPIHKLSNKYLVPKDYSQTYYEMFKEGKL